MKSIINVLSPENGEQISVRKTLPVSPIKAWQYLTSAPGISEWTGIESTALVPGRLYANSNVEFSVSVIKEYSHIRLKWRKKEWSAFSSLHVRLFSTEAGTTISLHQDHLSADIGRESMEAEWKQVLDKIAKLIA